VALLQTRSAAIRPTTGSPRSPFQTWSSGDAGRFEARGRGHAIQRVVRPRVGQEPRVGAPPGRPGGEVALPAAGERGASPPFRRSSRPGPAAARSTPVRSPPHTRRWRARPGRRSASRPRRRASARARRHGPVAEVAAAATTVSTRLTAAGPPSSRASPWSSGRSWRGDSWGVAGGPAGSGPGLVRPISMSRPRAWAEWLQKNLAPLT